MRKVVLSLRYQVSKALHWLYFKTLAPQMRVWNMDQYLAGTIKEYLKAFYESDRSSYFYWDQSLYDAGNYSREQEDLLKAASDEAYQELIWTFDVLSKGGPTEPEELVSAAMKGVEYHFEKINEDYSRLVRTGPENKDANEMLKKWRLDTDARIERNLQLFAKAFRGFWD